MGLAMMRGWAALALLMLAATAVGRAQTELPDAPEPQMLIAGSGGAGGSGGQETFPPEPRRQRGVRVPGLEPNYMPAPRECHTNTCSTQGPQLLCCQATGEHFADYLRLNAEHIYTPQELGRLALHGVFDPFSLLTIAWTSGLTIGTDSHSPYGPGMPGFAKLSGVALTQDMTGEFLGTFLIPSLDHQDPHFHRIPNAPILRRILHCIDQIGWTQSDTGRGMVNYAAIFGTIGDEAVGTTYVPYRQVGWGASAARIGTDLATAPIGNFITEFVPDVAQHINVRVVLVQRIIDRVAIEEGGGTP